MWISLKIPLKFVPKVQIHNIPALVQIMAWRWPGDKALSEPMMVSLLTHICVTQPQWVNPTGAETRIFCENYVNTMVANALISCITRTSAAMILTVMSKTTLYSMRKNFYYLDHLGSAKWYANIYFFCIFSKKFSTRRVNSLRPSDAYMRQ